MESAQEFIDMETFNSQEFMEYLNECRRIGVESQDPADDDNVSEDDEEQAEWLRQAGFGSVLSALGPDSESGGAQWEGFATLSHRQAAVVRRRLHAMKDTAQRRRGREAGRRPELRRLFTSEPESSDSRSRSATPDSLDWLTPPATPPEDSHRPETGSPHSQGYHSSSRRSLDRLDAADDGQQDSSSEYRHVLRIPLPCDPADWPQQGPETSRDQRPDRQPPPLPPPQQQRPKQRLHRGKAGADGALRPARRLPRSGQPEPAEASAERGDEPGVEAHSPHEVGPARLHRRQLTAADGEQGRLGPATGRHSDHRRQLTAADGRHSDAGTDAAVSAGPDLVVASPVEERLGRTRLGDLSDPDVQRVQKLALIELTCLLDEHGLRYGRRKPRHRRLGARPSADAGVLGTSLAALLKRDHQLAPAALRQVPLVFETILAHLERHGLREEGLLRVPGHRQKTEKLRQLFDQSFYSRPEEVAAALRASGPHDVAALFKQLLRQLPAPLLTDDSVEAFHRCDALPAGPAQLQALSMLCLRLPAVNRALLRRLLDFLAAVAAHEPANKMSLENLAVIMAPSLIPPRRRRQTDIAAEIRFASESSRVVRRLVQYRDRLWLVPPQLVRQIRLQHEEELYERARREAGGPMKKLLRRRDLAIVRKIDNEVDFQEGVIRVTAAQFGRPSWPVRLAPDTTAADLISCCIRETQARRSSRDRHHRRRASSPLPGDGSTACSLVASDLGSAVRGHFLHEHGGNIGERRLEHGAILLDCYQENPNARWVLHCCHGPELDSIELSAAF